MILLGALGWLLRPMVLKVDPKTTLLEPFVGLLLRSPQEPFRGYIEAAATPKKNP